MNILIALFNFLGWTELAAAIEGYKKKKRENIEVAKTEIQQAEEQIDEQAEEDINSLDAKSDDELDAELRDKL